MKILMIDDHALFRDGLLLVIDGLDANIEAFEAGSYETAIDIIATHSDLDLILLDLGLPGMSHLDALLALRKQAPDSLIVVLSGTEDHQMVEQVLRHGARGYITKSSPANVILHALKLIISGGTYIPAQILNTHPAMDPAPLVDQPQNRQRLTPRQTEVLHELAKGKSNKDIGKTLDLTESTVRAHVAAILKAFSASNRTQAVQYAATNGLLEMYFPGPKI
ncbi:MAG: response regulator transcription factor [Gammaproteobacteria bacterium]|nr:response regulator transcription factor [Gammaproteobacteria bacterium]